MGRSQRKLWKWTVIQVWPEGRKEDWVEASWLQCISTESSARPLERPQTIVRAVHLSQTWSCLSIPPCSCAAWPQHQPGMDFRAQQNGLWVNQSPTIRGLRPCSWLPRCPQNTPAGQPLKAAWALVKAAFLFSWHLSLDELLSSFYISISLPTKWDFSHTPPSLETLQGFIVEKGYCTTSSTHIFKTNCQYGSGGSQSLNCLQARKFG